MALQCIRESLIATFRQEPSATASNTVLDPEWLDQLTKKAKSFPQEQLTKSASLGTRAHGVIEDLCCGRDVEPEADLIAVAESFLSWKKSQPDLHIIDVEQLLYSEKHGYAGTADAIAMRTGGSRPGIIILDWKTSNALHADYAMQAAAYAKAWEEMNGETVAEAQVIRFDKYHAKYEARTVLSIENSFANFLHCLALYNGQKAPAFEDVPGVDDPLLPKE